MNENHDDRTLANNVAEVSEAYRTIPADEVPASLNRAILNEAAAEVSKPSAMGLFTTRIRPLAFAATAALSLALIFELSQEPGIEESGEFAGTAPLTEQNGGRSSAEGLSRAVAASGQRLQDLEASAEATRSGNSERRCSEQQSADPDAWWRCIEELRTAGMTEEALAELALLKTRYPDFDLPE
jgi:hypothetical protein